MNRNILSPYVRVAMHSTLRKNFIINERAIFDFELIYVAGGECEISFEGVPYNCKKGDAVLIPPGVHHKFTVGDSGFVQPHIHFDAVYTEKSDIIPVSFKPRSQMSEEEISLIRENIFSDIGIPYVFTPSDPQRFSAVFFSVIDCYIEKKSGYELECKARMLDLIAIILEQFDLGHGAVSAMSPMEAVKNYIDNNYAQIINLDMLEKQFYINKFTLMRNFKKMYRVNIIEYYRMRRTDFAKKTLKTTAMPIGDIGEALNFTDLYSFSRFFKMQTGMSPSEYREKSR